MGTGMGIEEFFFGFWSCAAVASTTSPELGADGRWWAWWSGGVRVTEGRDSTAIAARDRLSREWQEDVGEGESVLSLLLELLSKGFASTWWSMASVCDF